MEQQQQQQQRPWGKRPTRAMESGVLADLRAEVRKAPSNKSELRRRRERAVRTTSMLLNRQRRQVPPRLALRAL